MKEVLEQIILYMYAFIQETDRQKKEVLGKHVSNLCSTNFKMIAEENIEVAKLILPLIALGYFKVDDKRYDPHPNELINVIEELKVYIGNN